jgi:alkanesulfonate monooxygenase SsuD/methylene tetrahydromethanopterin reductase-like flavin-dependent oxidoreductase (luciferase family)
VGGYATVANYLDRLHDEAKLEACMFAFPDFEHDIDLFQQHIHPRLASRKGRMGGPR